jgi:hypothetical protein
MDGWSVICRPVGENADGKNTGGLAVLLVNARDPEFEHEVARVAYIRKEARSGNKKRPFDEVLAEVINVAQRATDTLNDLEDDFDSAKTAALVEARDKLTELFPPSATLA